MKMITDSILVESKTARENQLEQIEQEQAEKILNKIKSLYFALWQGTGTTTTLALSEYYEVSVETVQKIVQRHREEFKLDGLKNIRGKALKDVVDKLSISKRTPQLTIWTPRAALRLGMLLRDSTIAIAVRTSLLDIAEKVAPAIDKYAQNSPKLPSKKEQLEIVELGLNLFDRLGGWDERTNILLKDQLRNILLGEKLQPSLNPVAEEPKRLEYPVSDRAIGLGYQPNNSQLLRIGKHARKLYEEKHGCQPPKKEQFVGGTTRMVNAYGYEDLDLLDEAISTVMKSPSKKKLEKR